MQGNVSLGIKGDKKADATGIRGLAIAVLVLLAACSGLAGYLVHLKRLSDQRQQRLAQSPVPGPALPKTRTAILVVADDPAAKLIARKIELPPDAGEQMRAELRALFEIYAAPDSRHAFAPGAEVRDVYLLGSDTAVVDTNAAFADSHPRSARAETLTIESMVRTIGSNHPAIRRVKILVDGRERDTLAGHASLQDFFAASPQFTVRSSQ